MMAGKGGVVQRALRNVRNVTSHEGSCTSTSDLYFIRAI